MVLLLYTLIIWRIVKMNEFQEMLEEALEKIEELENRISEQESRFQAFAEPCAIGHEQLWEIVREDIQGLPVPTGINLRDLV